MKLLNLKPNNQYTTSHHIDIQFCLAPIKFNLFESTWLNGHRTTMDTKVRRYVELNLKQCYSSILDQVIDHETNRY